MPADRWPSHRRRLAEFAGYTAPLARSIAAALERIDALERKVEELRQQLATATSGQPQGDDQP